MTVAVICGHLHDAMRPSHLFALPHHRVGEGVISGLCNNMENVSSLFVHGLHLGEGGTYALGMCI
jgi:hypothetical protein